MTVQELLKPRYKVIDIYPNVDFFEVGAIIHGDGSFKDGSKISYYPHLFKPLQWWEERKESEMPKYVKRTDGSEVFQRHFQYNGGGSVMVQFPTGKYGKGTVGPIGLLNVLPATKEEYDQYIQSIKQ